MAAHCAAKSLHVCVMIFFAGLRQVGMVSGPLGCCGENFIIVENLPVWVPSSVEKKRTLDFAAPWSLKGCRH